jgi:hypothetical protein
MVSFFLFALVCSSMAAVAPTTRRTSSIPCTVKFGGRIERIRPGFCIPTADCKQSEGRQSFGDRCPGSGQCCVQVI